MSTLAYVDSEIITQADGAQNSRAPSEGEESQPLGSRVPLMGEEFEASEPSSTMTISSHSSALSDFTAPLSPDHLLSQASPTATPTRVSFHRKTTRIVVHTQPTLSPGRSIRIAKAAALSPSSFHLDVKRDSSEGEHHGLESEGHGLEDEGPGSEDEEEAEPEGQQQAISVVDTTVNEPLGLGYRALRRQHEGAERISAFRQPTLVTWVDPEDDKVYTDILTYIPLAAPIQTPPSPEWSSGSLPVSPSSLVVPSPIASLVTTPATTISVDEDQFLEGYGRDLRELYTRSKEARDEFFSQRYRFRSLERE
ncbi:hypothetical protein Tco_1249221 [Tanacetum coccineum]